MVFRILTAAFQQRRKMMRQSLKGERSPALPCLAFSFLSIYPLPFTSLLLTRVLLSPLEFHFLSYLNSSLFACIHSNPCLDFILYIPSHLSWSLPPICLPAYLPACLPACLSLLLPLWIWLSKGFKHHANCGYIMFWIMWDVHVLGWLLTPAWHQYIFIHYTDLLNQEKLVLSEQWGTKRPEELSPTDFIQLTIDLFGEDIQPIRGSTTTPASSSSSPPPISSPSSPSTSSSKKSLVDVQPAAQPDQVNVSSDRTAYVSRPVWRKALFGASGSPTFNAKPSDKK